MENKSFLLYKIYYDGRLVYLGRTTQILQDRMRGHVFGNKILKKIDINKVSKIEYAEFKTKADMYLYEIYYINLYKPELNKDDKSNDNLTIKLPDVDFREWKTSLWEKWRKEINERNRNCKILQEKIQKYNESYEIKKYELQTLYKNKVITGDEYVGYMEELKRKKAMFDYNNGLITFEDYKEKVGFHELENKKEIV